MRAIDADAFDERVRAAGGMSEEELTEDFKDGVQAVLYMLSNQPTIQPEIIRCKDCKHWIPYDWMFSEVWQSKNIADYPEDEIGCAWSDMAMKANDFCSRAERREVTT